MRFPALLGTAPSGRSSSISGYDSRCSRFYEFDLGGAGLLEHQMNALVVET